MNRNINSIGNSNSNSNSLSLSNSNSNSLSNSNSNSNMNISKITKIQNNEHIYSLSINLYLETIHYANHGETQSWTSLTNYHHSESIYENDECPNNINSYNDDTFKCRGRSASAPLSYRNINDDINPNMRRNSVGGPIKKLKKSKSFGSSTSRDSRNKSLSDSPLYGSPKRIKRILYRKISNSSSGKTKYSCCELSYLTKTTKCHDLLCEKNELKFIGDFILDIEDKEFKSLMQII